MGWKTKRIAKIGLSRPKSNQKTGISQLKSIGLINKQYGMLQALIDLIFPPSTYPEFVPVPVKNRQ